MPDSIFEWNNQHDDNLGEQSLDISYRIDRLSCKLDKLLRVLSAGISGGCESSDQIKFAESGQTRTPVPPLPDPRFIRTILRNRHHRNRHFSSNLFADPAWDMLLDLAAAQAEFLRVSVTSLCIASGVPATTALRYIDILIEQGLIERVPDTTDKRRSWVELTKKGVDMVASYFSKIGPPTRQFVL